LRKPFSTSSSYRSYEPRPVPPWRPSSRISAPPISVDFRALKKLRDFPTHGEKSGTLSRTWRPKFSKCYAVGLTEHFYIAYWVKVAEKDTEGKGEDCPCSRVRSQILALSVILLFLVGAEFTGIPRGRQTARSAPVTSPDLGEGLGDRAALTGGTKARDGRAKSRVAAGRTSIRS